MKKEKVLMALGYLPLVVYLLFFMFIMSSGQSINYFTFIISVLLLFLASYGLYNKNKTIRAIGVVATGLFTLWYAIMGQYDYLKWTSTIIGLIFFFYYMVLFYYYNRVIR